MLDFHILLGSKSPRRQELLQGLGLPFTLVNINCDEDFPQDMPAAQVPEYLARKKSFAYTENLTQQQILLTADTVVVVENEILNKPTDAPEALKMLEKLNGKVHEVITGVCLRNGEKTRIFSERTAVYVSALSNEFLQHYIKYYEPYDKAGAYGIQEFFGLAGIYKIEGSYPNVVGLPTARIWDELQLWK